MSLPALSRNADTLAITTTVNRLVREFNRPDRKAPIVGTDTGSGAAYAIAPVPGIVLYEVGQEFTFQAANANTTTTPTLAVNGLTAGTITCLDGSALAVGDIAASGWVDVIVASVTAGTPTFALISTPSVAGKRLLQMVSFETGAAAQGTTLVPYDDTIPQNTEGDQYMSLSITPRSAASRLEIAVLAYFTHGSGTNNVIGALFQDSGANALAAQMTGFYAGSAPTQLALAHVMASPGTGTYTFKFRAGLQVASDTLHFNSNAASSRVFGGVCASTMIIREVA